jgi:hypothetical protein
MKHSRLSSLISVLHYLTPACSICSRTTQIGTVTYTNAALWTEAVVPHQYLITVLTAGTPYYVRVRALATATAALGYGPAATAAAAVAPAVQAPAKPTGVTVNLSKGALGPVVSDKLIVHWVAPAVDSVQGIFAAAIDSAALIKQYVLQASTSADFSAPLVEYTATTLADCGAPTGCSFPLGAEVQTITVYAQNGSPLTAGGFKLSAAGYAASPTACIPYDDNLSTMETELEALFGLSTNGITVQKEAITAPALGFKYYITFAGLEGNVPQLTASVGGCTAFSSAQVITVATDTNSSNGALEAGTPYYVRVAAKRGALVGAFAAAAAAETPRAPPGAPLSATVTADTATAGTVHVAWTAVDTDNGGPVTSYVVEYQIAGGSWVAGVGTGVVPVTSSPAVLTSYTAAAGGVLCTDAIEVRVRAVNDQLVSPKWTVAVPTCPPDVESCVEPAPLAITPTAILRRRLPRLPALTVPQHTPMGANAFTKNSLVVSLVTNAADTAACPALSVGNWKVGILIQCTL